MLTERVADLKPWGSPGFHIVADGAFVIDVRSLTEGVRITVVKDGKRLPRHYQPGQRVRLHTEFEQYHAQLAAAVADRNAEHPGSGDCHVQELLGHIAPDLELSPQAAIRWLAAHASCRAALEQIGCAEPEHGLPRRLPMMVYTTRRYVGAAPVVRRALGLPLGASVARFLLVAQSAVAARDLYHGMQAGRRTTLDNVVVAGGVASMREEADYADLLHSAGLTVCPGVYALPPREHDGSLVVQIASPGEVVTMGTLYEVVEDPYPHMRINPDTVVKGQP